MLDKIKRKKKIDTQDLQPPQTIKDLIRRYDLDNVKIENYLDYLVDSLIEYGNWTPTMENATVSYSTRTGRYIKVGPLVYIECQLRGTISAVEDAAYAYISGLPFQRVYPGGGGIVREYSRCIVANTNPPTWLVGYDTTIGNGNYISIQNTSTANGTSTTTWTTTSDTFYLFISGWYINRNEI